jgi:Na+-transporting methylmalonyl-CoA/oxaloacetate decarboxylase gamma subunit
MTIVFAILFLLALAFAVLFALRHKRLEETLQRVQAETQASVAEAQRAAEAKIAAAQRQSEISLAEAQKLIDQQLAEIQKESERVRQHFETESRKIQDAADALVAKTFKDFEPLRKYEKLRDAETEAQRQMSDALKEATNLRSEAQILLEQARTFAANERSLAIQKAKDIREEAEALLSQATRDAGRILAEAEKRANQIGGDAYVALRDKQTLEQALPALWNATEGYGDRYVVPTHSLLDDLAIDFGYTEAGQSLRFAREQSRRMVEQKQAASCNYEEPDRRDRANRFVVDAFNGRVDAILSRSKHDNYGTLEKEIRDAFSLVNLNGLVFRDARILQPYLDVRLAELKWAVVVHELARKQREEQRYLKERLRDEEKARKEYDEKMRQAAKEEDLKRRAVEEAEQRFAGASAEQKARYEEELQKLRQDLSDATQRALTIAQQTKKGHVYIISNIGAFGEGVYKIGQTRRPEPRDRVDELSGASVPFEFDIHALIESDNAPALEHKIHKKFLAMQVNRMNVRKEFFRVNLMDIRKEIDKLNQGEDFTITKWTDKAAATEYKESLDIENDPDKKEKWLAHQRARTDRQLRMDLLVLPVSPDMDPDEENQE